MRSRGLLQILLDHLAVCCCRRCYGEASYRDLDPRQTVRGRRIPVWELGQMSDHYLNAADMRSPNDRWTDR